MMTQVRLEAFKLTHRLRSYLGFGALAAMSGLMVLGLALGPPPLEASFPRQFVMVGTYLNGGFVAWMLLRIALHFFLPLFACVVTGDLISGEATDGTLRSVLSRPVKRSSIFIGKFLVSVVYVVALTFFLGIAAYGIGSIFLGRGVLVTFQEGTMLGAQGVYVYPEIEGLVRLAAAYAFASLAVLSIGTIAFFLSTVVTNSLGAIGGAMIAMVVFQIIGIIEFFKPVHPYLFTTHLDGIGWFFVNDIPWQEVGKSAAVLAGYIIVFFTAGLVVFARKDVLT